MAVIGITLLHPTANRRRTYDTPIIVPTLFDYCCVAVIGLNLPCPSLIYAFSMPFVRLAFLLSTARSLGLNGVLVGCLYFY